MMSIRPHPCSHTGHPWRRIGYAVVGFAALVWFLVRVIPKPSRATYPCQRAAFPLASSFVIWCLALLGSVRCLRRIQQGIPHRRHILRMSCYAVAVTCLWLALTMTSDESVMAEAPAANQPIGQAKGVFPGRVVWGHDPLATKWQGRSGPWDPLYTDQQRVDALVSRAVCQLAGQSSDKPAWDVLFKHFNQGHGRGARGYTSGEKIAIKINLTTCGLRNNSVDRNSYEKRSSLQSSDTSPQMIVAVLRQLIDHAGVDPHHIAVGDTTALFPNQWWWICHKAFPEVTFFDLLGERGRVRTGPSSIVQYWSQPHGSDLERDYIPQIFAEAAYVINMAVLKSHAAGITLCGKNHYGSYIRLPGDPGYFDLHNSLACYEKRGGQYRAFVDIMGHPHLGGKTVLYIIDGLYGGQGWAAEPHRFKTAPFNNHWPSSVLMSMDPVAVDSVGLEILWEEWPGLVRVPAVDDYLREAALADNPPSGTFYDPDGDGKPLASLGVYERWNNPTERKYSRNLGTGEGIELVYFRADAPSKPTAKAVHEKGTAGRTEPSLVRTLF